MGIINRVIDVWINIFIILILLFINFENLQGTGKHERSLNIIIVILIVILDRLNLGYTLVGSR